MLKVPHNRAIQSPNTARRCKKYRAYTADIAVSKQVRHKPACTSTEKSYKLEISNLSRRGIVLSE